MGRRLAAVHGGRVGSAVEESVRVSAVRIEARRETGGGDGEVRAVGAGRAAQAERDALERAAAEAELAQPRVDLRIPLEGGGVEVEVRVETLELDAVVVEVPAVRAGDDHGLGEGAAEEMGRASS